MPEHTLVPVEQKTVLFYDDEVLAVRIQNGSVYVPIRPICTLLDVNFDGQRRRIARDGVLSEESALVVVTATGVESNSRRPRTREMLALPLDYISGFLFGINANRVKEEVRDRLLRYQRECYKVLSEAFVEGRLNPDTDFEELLQNADNPAVQAYKTFQALAKLARHQVILESRIDHHEARIEQLEAIVGDSKHHVTPSQASQISQAVKIVARELGRGSRRNEYGGVYGELYRRFQITSYKQLPTRDFDEAMAFLTDWYQDLTDSDSVPF